MYTVYGRVDCENCVKLKDKLIEKQYEFKYKDIDEIPKVEKFDLLKLAKANKQMSLPIVIIDEVFIKTADLEKILA
jgi:glutaredoxin